MTLRFRSSITSSLTTFLAILSIGFSSQGAVGGVKIEPNQVKVLDIEVGENEKLVSVTLKDGTALLFSIYNPEEYDMRRYQVIKDLRTLCLSKVVGPDFPILYRLKTIISHGIATQLTWAGIKHGFVQVEGEERVIPADEIGRYVWERNAFKRRTELHNSQLLLNDAQSLVTQLIENRKKQSDREDSEARMHILENTLDKAESLRPRALQLNSNWFRKHILFQRQVNNLYLELHTLYNDFNEHIADKLQLDPLQFKWLNENSPTGENELLSLKNANTQSVLSKIENKLTEDLMLSPLIDLKPELSIDDFKIHLPADVTDKGKLRREGVATLSWSLTFDGKNPSERVTRNYKLEFNNRTNGSLQDTADQWMRLFMTDYRKAIKALDREFEEAQLASDGACARLLADQSRKTD
jgi:hypothetical protein